MNTFLGALLIFVMTQTIGAVFLGSLDNWAFWRKNPGPNRSRVKGIFWLFMSWPICLVYMLKDHGRGRYYGFPQVFGGLCSWSVLGYLAALLLVWRSELAFIVALALFFAGTLVWLIIAFVFVYGRELIA